MLKYFTSESIVLQPIIAYSGLEPACLFSGFCILKEINIYEKN